MYAATAFAFCGYMKYRIPSICTIIHKLESFFDKHTVRYVFCTTAKLIDLMLIQQGSIIFLDGLCELSIRVQI